MNNYDNLINILHNAYNISKRPHLYHLESRISQWINKCVIFFTIILIFLLTAGLLTRERFPSISNFFIITYIFITIIYSVLLSFLIFLSVFISLHYFIKDKRHKIIKIKINEKLNLSKSLRYTTTKNLKKSKIFFEGENNLRKTLISFHIGILSIPIIGYLQNNIYNITNISNIINKEYWTFLIKILFLITLINLFINFSHIKKFHYFISLINLEIENRK